MGALGIDWYIDVFSHKASHSVISSPQVSNLNKVENSLNSGLIALLGSRHAQQPLCDIPNSFSLLLRSTG